MNHTPFLYSFFIMVKITLTMMVAALSFNGVQAQGRLILNGGKVNIANGAVVVLANSNANAITRVSGHIISEGQNNRIHWNIGTTTGNYTIPWGRGNALYFPVSFSPSTAAGSGSIYFSTLSTAAQNSLSLPGGITHFNGTNGEDVSLIAVDRFWRIDPQGYTTKPTLSNLVFTYLDAEFAAPNKTSVENKLTALRWNNNLASWSDYTTGAAVNTVSNTITLTSLPASELNAWWSVAYPGSNFHWIASTQSDWNTQSNWSLAAGGTGGAGIPSYGDVAYFDDVRDGGCTVDTNLDVFSIRVANGYSGTIQQNSYSVNVTRGASFSGGVFQGGSGAVTIEGDLTISGSSFTSTSGVLDVKQNLNLNSGSFAHNNGTVRFSGTQGTQVISSVTTPVFNHLEVTNTSATPGLRMESNAALSGILNLASNVIVDLDGLANNRIFTLLSTADNPTHDAAIGILPSGAQVIGNVTVQRYMAIEGPSGGRIYRYISSPVKQASAADIQNEIPITGTFTGRSTCSGCGSTPSLFSYDESIITNINGDATTDLNDGYINFPVSSNAEILETGRGYSMFVRGNIIASARWDVRGAIHTGNVTPVVFPVSHTSSGVAENDGWNLVGNPFPSTIDWNASTGWAKTNINSAIYFRDNGSSVGQFAVWNGVVGVNGGSRYIATGQAFWINTSGAGTPVLTATENVKAPGVQTLFFREETHSKLLRIALKQGAVRDEAVIHFREDATSGFDAGADAKKLLNTTFSLSTQINDKDKMAINSLSPVSCNNTISLVMDYVPKGSFTMEFTDLETFPASTVITVTDAFTGQSFDVRSINDYSFVVTADPLSYSSKRFELSISWPVSTPEFSASTASVCEGLDAQAIIHNVQTENTITAWIDGQELMPASKMGSDINFIIPRQYLTRGENSIVVRSTPSGCGVPTEKISVLQVEQTLTPVSVTGSSLCREGVATLAAQGASPGSYYQWYETDSSAPLLTTSDSVWITPLLKKSKTYFVGIVNRLGCEGNRVPVSATVIQYDYPIITWQNDSLKTNFSTGIQWYRDGLELAGEQSSSVYPNAPGKYSVVIDVQGCITSTDYVYSPREEVVTEVEDGEQVQVKIYPNPVVNELFITMPSSVYNGKEVRVRNAQGKFIGGVTLETNNGNTTGTFNMANKAAGLYIVEVVTAEGTHEFKVIKK